MTIDHEAAAAASNGGKIDGAGGCFPEDHIGATGVGAGSRIAASSPNDEISESIAVDIARTGDADAAGVRGALTIDHEAAAAASNGGEVDGDGGCVGVVSERWRGANSTRVARCIGIGASGYGDRGCA